MLLINKAFLSYDEIQEALFLVAFIQILFIRGGDQLIADSGGLQKLEPPLFISALKARVYRCPGRTPVSGRL